MNTVSEVIDTEQLIKEKARELFFQKGYLNATTQEIADEAGVNRALIHYYFKSREQMLDILLDETIQEKRNNIRHILSSGLTLREKVARYIDIVVDYGLKYPYLENFLISETARNPRKLRDHCERSKWKTTDLISKQLEEEIQQGKLAPISAEHFMVNLSSLCNYPLLAKPVMQAVYDMTDAGFQKFLKQRKKVIYRTIFGDDMPSTNN